MKMEKETGNTIKLTFDVSAEEFEKALGHAFEHVVQDVEIKGFRKGKVPRDIYEKRFGVESLFEEALNHLIPEKYNEAFSLPNFEPVGQPKIDLDFPNLKRGESFSFTAVVPVKPDVELGQYKELKANKIDAIVTDEDVDNAIKQLLNKDATLEPKDVDKLEEGDTAVLDFEGFVDGEAFAGGKAEGHSLEIGSNNFIPGFEAQMVGMQTGEERDINVTFPEKYQSEELAGKDAVFKVKLHEIKTQKGQSLNDEFVKGLEREGIETVEQLKADVRQKLEKQKEQNERGRLIDDLISQAAANAKVDIPAPMIEHEMSHMKQDIENRAKQYQLDLETFVTLSGSSMDKFNEDLEREAHKKTLYNLVIEAIAKAENITVDAEQISEKIKELAQQYNMSVDDIKKYINDDMIESDLKYQKALDLLIETANLS